MRSARAEALETLMSEAVALTHRLRAAAEEMHGEGELTAGRRGVLRSLQSGGPQTVPQLARSRPVSRQHIQMLVDGLAEDGLVEFVENPAHRRSRLVRLTAAGRQRFERMRARETEVFAALRLPIETGRLAEATAVLRQIKTALEGSEWKRLLETRSAPPGGERISATRGGGRAGSRDN